jgi:hypothetical protein
VQLAQFNLQQQLLLPTTARCSKGDCLREARVPQVTAPAAQASQTDYGFNYGPQLQSSVEASFNSCLKQQKGLELAACKTLA